MNDEIKEILERPNVYSFNDECYLYFGDYNKLKDYITNLQQENERLNYQLEVQKELTVRNRLRKHCYKSRIEKAVEYIKEDYERNQEVIEYCGFDGFYKKLLNILNGRSDE